MLLAVHISDGYLTSWWLLGGFAVALILAWVGSRRIQDAEIPRIAILTAAFFIASLIHVKVPPTSVHLLLNGLVGILLGWRAALAIPIALFLQFVLLGHGGLTTVGVNSCIMVVPALFSWGLFRLMNWVRWSRHTWLRSLLVACSSMIFLFSAIFCLALLEANWGAAQTTLDFESANAIWLSPWIWCGALAFAGVSVFLERRLEAAPEFPLGLILGELSVLLTLALNCAVLLLGGQTYWPTPPLILIVAHLPIAVVEGIILGFTVGFLAKVKPDLLGIQISHEANPTLVQELPDVVSSLHLFLVNLVTQ